MKHPLTLAEARASGRDPTALFFADRATLLDPAWLARVESGAPLMFWGDEGDDAPESTPYEIVGSVAVVDVEGPIAQRGWFCIDGYDTIAMTLDQALADPKASSVLLRMNSPGGAAAGAFEWTRRMRDAVVASGKRVVAYADEMAFSGAYAIACVADEVVVPETGCVGSVGVIGSMVSRAKKNAADGIDVRVIRAGAEKADGHPDLPMDPAAVERAQVEIDQLAAIFHRWVGERRRMTVDAVAALEAGTRMGPDAVTAGLADRVLGYHALLAEMQRTPKPGATRITAPTGARTTRNTMNETQLAALYAALGETDPDKIVAAVTGMKANAEATAATITKLSADLSASNERATAALSRVDKIERDAEITAAKAEGKWSPALEGFLGTLSTQQLAAWRTSAPRVVPGGQHEPPTDGPEDATQIPADVASLAAKGWTKLTAAEKHTVTTHDPKLAARLRKAG